MDETTRTAIQGYGERFASEAPALFAWASLFLRPVVRTRLDPEDLVQEAWTVALPKLRDLEARDPLKSRLVELRFFTGLSMPELAEVLGLPLTRVEREWRFTLAWLQRRVDGIRRGN